MVARGDCAISGRAAGGRGGRTDQALRESGVPAVLLRRFADAPAAVVLDDDLREPAQGGGIFAKARNPAKE